MYIDQHYEVNVHKSEKYCCWYVATMIDQEYEEISEKWFHFVEERIFQFDEKHFLWGWWRTVSNDNEKLFQMTML